jgi:hypothetical protein
MRICTSTIAAAFLLAAHSGCAGLATESCVEHLRGGATLCGRAPVDGEYLLWQIRAEGFEHQLQEVTLRKGDPIGFDCSGQTVVAVAGANHFALPDGWYRWYRRVPKGEQTAIVALRIALFPVMLAAFSGGGP